MPTMPEQLVFELPHRAAMGLEGIPSLDLVVVRTGTYVKDQGPSVADPNLFGKYPPDDLVPGKGTIAPDTWTTPTSSARSSLRSRIEHLAAPVSSAMVDLLAADPVLLAFLVIGFGAGVGAIRIRGVSIGRGAVRRSGHQQAIDASLSGAAGLTVLRELGLVLFTYTIGLASGPTFVAGVRRGGLAAIVATVGLVIAAAGFCAGIAEVLSLSPADRAGLFAGSTTNTPALQAAAAAVDSGNPVVAYSLAYPRRSDHDAGDDQPRAQPSAPVPTRRWPPP